MNNNASSKTNNVLTDNTPRTIMTKRDVANAYRQVAILTEKSPTLFNNKVVTDEIADSMRKIARAIDHGGKFGVR